jgi:YD repeat-containing protein
MFLEKILVKLVECLPISVLNKINSLLENSNKTREREEMMNLYRRLSKMDERVSYANNQKIYDKEGNWEQFNCDDNGNILSYENSDGIWQKNTYNEAGKLLTHENSDGFSIKNTYNENNDLLTSQESNGISTTITYNENGIISSYKNSFSKYSLKLNPGKIINEDEIEHE